MSYLIQILKDLVQNYSIDQFTLLIWYEYKFNWRMWLVKLPWGDLLERRHLALLELLETTETLSPLWLYSVLQSRVSLHSQMIFGWVQTHRLDQFCSEIVITYGISHSWYDLCWPADFTGKASQAKNECCSLPLWKRALESEKRSSVYCANQNIRIQSCWARIIFHILIFTRIHKWNAAL